MPALKTKPSPCDPIKDRRHIRAIKDMLKAKEERVKYLFFTVGINAGFRVSDLCNLVVSDLWDEDGEPRREFSKRAQKNNALIVTQINKAITEAMDYASQVLPMHDLDAPVFPGRNGKPVHRATAWRWLSGWCHAVGLDKGNYGSHTLRKTFCYQMWCEHGKSFEALLIVCRALGHKNTEQTMDYLGIRRQQIAKLQSRMNL